MKYDMAERGDFLAVAEGWELIQFLDEAKKAIGPPLQARRRRENESTNDANGLCHKAVEWQIPTELLWHVPRIGQFICARECEHWHIDRVEWKGHDSRVICYASLASTGAVVNAASLLFSENERTADGSYRRVWRNIEGAGKFGATISFAADGPTCWLIGELAMNESLFTVPDRWRVVDGEGRCFSVVEWRRSAKGWMATLAPAKTECDHVD